MRILLAENNDDVRETICAMLEELSCDVVAVASIEEADALLKAKPWDLLVTDLLFPSRRTGVDLAQEAHARGAFAVVISGALEAPSLVAATGVAFLAKPFKFSDLSALLPSPIGAAHRMAA